VNVIGPIVFALLAAVGNALFVLGQKKAQPLDNAFLFIALTVVTCALLMIMAIPLFGSIGLANAIRVNRQWILLSGLGLFITFMGFNLLYGKYGASSYIIYAISSIITTSLVVGMYFLKEQFNVYHWLAFGSSLITISLYSLGNSLRG